ncbi:MAG: D-glycero-beta-D-manno-heptose-7-phosphate kinase [Alphaproteobacteria bacterium]|nr:D-glycero-beta-D-manno-heptose-7-phosphate kinase [Alphaproteobacteria bacterium]
MDTQLINKFSATRILCIGDAMLDRFVRGSISRISPEAPIPVLHIKEEETALGGAGNVVRNLEALGCTVTFISIVGKDQSGSRIQELLNASPKIKSHLMVDEKRETTTKTRFIASNQQVLRTDAERALALNQTQEIELLKLFKDHIQNHDLVILSDYAKGFFSPQGLAALIQEARTYEKPVLVDPKGHDYSRYKGATLLTPNRQELSHATLRSTQTHNEVVEAAQKIITMCDLKALITTRGPKGMSLVEASGTVEHLPTTALEIFDVSGAGDTVIATLGAAFAAGGSLSEAMHLANVAAGLVVAKVGTAVVHQDELLTALHHQELESHEKKIVGWQAAQDITQKWKRRGHRVVFTNGCFDLLHPGHVSLLAAARKAGDRLIVGLNTDISVSRYKGPARPIQPEVARALVLASLASVDLVVLFGQDFPLELIEALKPDVLVKGADYTIDKVSGASFVQSYGGEVLLIDLVKGQSTTGIVSRIGK